MINSECICSKRARSHYYSARVLFFSRGDSHGAAVNRQLFTGPRRIQSVRQRELRLRHTEGLTRLTPYVNEHRLQWHARVWVAISVTAKRLKVDSNILSKISVSRYFKQDHISQNLWHPKRLELSANFYLSVAPKLACQDFGLFIAKS